MTAATFMSAIPLTTRLAICSAFFFTLLSSAALAARITGTSGDITGATTTAALVNNAGGCTGPAAAGCTIDGDISGAAGGFVEYSHQRIESFTYMLNGAYDLTDFLLWNDRGARDSGIDDFKLTFNHIGGTKTLFNGVALANRGSNPTPETFPVGLRKGVLSVDLDILSTHSPGGNNQFREIAFVAVPEPTTALLGSVAMLAIGCVRKRSHQGRTSSIC